MDGRSPRPVTPAPICGFEASHSGRLLAAVTPEGDQCVVSTQSLRAVQYRKGAHMTFATAVAFAPDDSAILSTSADASATLTELRNVTGGRGAVLGRVGVVAAVAAVVLLLIAMVLGLLKNFVEESPREAEEFLQGLPEWLSTPIQKLILL